MSALGETQHFGCHIDIEARMALSAAVIRARWFECHITLPLRSLSLDATVFKQSDLEQPCRLAAIKRAVRLAQGTCCEAESAMAGS